MKVEFKGGKEFEAALKLLGSAVSARRVGEQLLTNAAEPVRAEAVMLAPDDPTTGPGKYLRDSIKISLNKASSAASRNFRRNTLAGQRLVEVYIGIDGSVKPAAAPKTARRRKRKAGGVSGGGVGAYSIFQEFGTSSTPAHPFMTPAWEAKQGEALSIIQAQIGDVVAKAAARSAKRLK